jgi:superfamily II DNA or RNA helicase
MVDAIATAEAAAAPRRAGRDYWRAQGIAELAQSSFDDATERGDRAGQRRAFYLLAGFYSRTLHIVRSALAVRKELLAQAALGNLVALHRPLTYMHRAAPASLPLALVIDRAARDDLTRDLVVRVLSESPEALSAATIVERVNGLDILGAVAPGTIRRLLTNLEASGHVRRVDRGYVRDTRTYTELDLGSMSLRALLGPDLHERLAADGYRGLSDVDARRDDFRRRFTEVAGSGAAVADLIVEVAATLLDTRPPEPSSWRHADLLNSPYPRPYQYEAYAVFRGAGYRGQLVESPTGSGKTMIGMMCIQDWLRSLRPGQSILVLVPTANYQQQWIGELCFKPIGLRLPPESVFSGTPTQLERFQRRTGSHPAVILMTYAVLAQTGSGVGKGGFDVDSIEIFLQAANVQYVALDEVHKVVEDMRSVSADVTRQLVAWLLDGSIRGLIGFSGTAEAYRPRFAELGLTLAHRIPLETLIGYGFVAPFAEFGVPFANSERERRIRDLLDAYKARLLEYVGLLGAERLRRWFADIPMPERVAIARQQLRMYRGRADGDEATARRLGEWERGETLGIADVQLVTIIQIARGLPDAELAQLAGVDPDAFDTIRAALDATRRELADLIYLPATVARLRATGFATTLDRDFLLATPAEPWSAARRAEHTENLLATTIVGLYGGLTDWYLRTGEGRVETIKALLDAERGERPVTGTIVFDAGKRIRWRTGLTAPGYDGVGGLFAQLLGDARVTAFAVLYSEMYLTLDETDPLPPRIARFIEAELMRGEIAQAIFGLSTQGLDLPAETLTALRDRFGELIDEYVATLSGVRARRFGDFRRRVLSPLRQSARRLVRGATGDRLRARLSTRNVHLAELITTFYDYAALAESFRRPRIGEIEQVSGARQRFYVLPMPGGRRKQLMYDLTARIVDADDLGLNLVIVSSWARTGWNVIKPNVLIDATATRDVTAWQQLRGRAMRALRTWTNDSYRLLLLLRGDQELDGEATGVLSGDTLRALAQSPAAPAEMRDRFNGANLAGLTAEDRQSLAIGLMLTRNKVTHIYELIKASGSTRQVEYDRTTRRWQRREAIAHKHAYETSVEPFGGAVVSGVEHAPLLYASDPRTDLPADLRARVADVIRDRDPFIVAGWMAADDR